MNLDDVGKPGQKSGKGSRGTIIYFNYNGSYSGLSDMTMNMYGELVGVPGKVGVNQIIH